VKNLAGENEKQPKRHPVSIYLPQLPVIRLRMVFHLRKGKGKAKPRDSGAEACLSQEAGEVSRKKFLLQPISLFIIFMKSVIDLITLRIIFINKYYQSKK